jgi:hypothetical protein
VTCKAWQEAEHYPIIKSWYLRVSRGGGAPHETHLPEFGVVAYLGETPGAMVFAYRDLDTAVAHVEWFICNPDLSWGEKLRCGVAAFEFLLKNLYDNGYDLVRMSLNDERLAKFVAKRWQLEKFPEPLWHLIGLTCKTTTDPVDQAHG